MRKYFRVLLLTVGLLLLMTSPAYATEITTDGGSSTVDVKFSAEATDFDVIVPIQLVVQLLHNGTIVCADSGVAAIVNNSPMGNAEVTDITFTAKNGYTIGNFDDNWITKNVNTPEIAFKLNTEKVDPATGKIALDSANWPIIPPVGGSLPLTYDAHLSGQATAFNDIVGLQAVVVVGWAQ